MRISQIGRDYQKRQVGEAGDGTALPDFGITTRMLAECRDLSCVSEVAALSKVATKVEWKPIVIFEKEAAQ